MFLDLARFVQAVLASRTVRVSSSMEKFTANTRTVVYIVPRQKCKSTELYKSPPNGQPNSTRPPHAQSILSPGQGWHRRANAHRRYKVPSVVTPLGHMIPPMMSGWDPPVVVDPYFAFLAWVALEPLRFRDFSMHAYGARVLGHCLHTLHASYPPLVLLAGAGRRESASRTPRAWRGSGESACMRARHLLKPNSSACRGS